MRRLQRDRFIFTLVILAAFTSMAAADHTIQPPHLGNGLKIGEVTSNSAIVWTRTTGKGRPTDPTLNGQRSEEKTVSRRAKSTKSEAAAETTAKGRGEAQESAAPAGLVECEPRRSCH